MAGQELIASVPKARERGGTRRVITDLVSIRLAADDTGDTVTVLEIETPPGGGVPPHSQRYEDETIHVLQGAYLMLTGEEHQELGPGDTRFVARGVRHGFVNAGPGTARMLVYLSPGGIHEQFINEVGDAPGRPMWDSDLARIVSLAPAYGIEFDGVDD